MEELIEEQEIPVETEEVSEVETEEATTSEEETTVDTPPEPEPKSSGIQKRINELTRARYDAERRAEKLEERLHEVYKAPQTSVPTLESPPKEDDYDTYEEYIDARAKYVARMEVASERQKIEDQRKREAEEQKTKTFQERLQAQRSKGNAKFEDFYDVTATFNVSKDVVAATLESDIGDEIIYYLATHPEEAVRIQSMSTHGQALEVGRLETKLKNPPKKITSAPDPIAPVSTSGVDTTVNLYSDKVNDDDWAREFRKKRQKMRGF